MKKSPVKILILDSYLATIKNALGAKIFRNLFARVNGKRTDPEKWRIVLRGFYPGYSADIRFN